MSNDAFSLSPGKLIQRAAVIQLSCVDLYQIALTFISRVAYIWGNSKHVLLVRPDNFLGNLSLQCGVTFSLVHLCCSLVDRLTNMYTNYVEVTKCVPTLKRISDF